MKNIYKNRSHISTRKLRMVLQEFVLDREASKTAISTGLNRKTVNKLFELFRARIVLLAEQEKPNNLDNVQVDESYFGAAKSTRSWWNTKVAVFGIISPDRVYTKILNKPCKAEIYPVIRDICKPGAVVFSDRSPIYNGLTNEGFIHHSVNHSAYEFGRIEGDMIRTNRIESYWAWTKLRLSKFKGIRYDKYYVHLKECEWRFNHRQDDIYRLLLRMFRDIPIS